MNDQEALLQAVLDEPDDDGVRLVYADWCEENGQAKRAEFIRLQIELANHHIHTLDPMLRCGCKFNEGHKSGCSWLQLRHREAELTSQHGLEWFLQTMPAGLADVPGCKPSDLSCRYPGMQTIKYRRGFVEAVTCSDEAWLNYVDVLLKAQPIREVCLTSWNAEDYLNPMLHNAIHGVGPFHEERTN